MSNTIYSDKIKVNCPLVHDENGYYHLIYRTTNLKNNKIYVGKHSTKNPYDDYMGSGLKIVQAIKEDGIKCFVKEILYCFSDEKEAYLKEAEIVTKGFVNRDDTYNIAVGGNMVAGSWSGENAPWYGKHLSQEIRDKISKALKRKYTYEKSGMYGKCHTQETKEKMSKNHADVSGEKNPMYGKSPSQETRDKISKANKGKFAGEKNPMYGKPRSQETKDKISKANKGKRHTQETKDNYSKARKGGNNPRAKAVLKLDEFGNIITEYGCIKECCVQENFSDALFYKIIKNHILHNGFYFEYKSKN